MDHQRLCGSNVADGIETGLEHFPVRIKMNGNGPFFRADTGNDVDPGLVAIHFFDKAGAGKVRQPDAGGVSFCFFRKVSYVNPLCPGSRSKVPQQIPVSSGDIGIHTGTGDVLSDPIHNQDIDLIERKLGSSFLCNHKQLFLPFKDILRQQGLYETGIMKGVFHRPQAKKNWAAFHYLKSHGFDNSLERQLNGGLVIVFSAFLLSHTDGHHLHQSAFNGSIKLCMCFYPVYHHDMICSRGIFVHVNRIPEGRISQKDRFHVAFDRAFHGRLGDSQPLENLNLAFRRSPAVTSHGRKDKGRGTQFFKFVHDGLYNDVDIGHASAARGNRNGIARFYFISKLKPCHFLPDGLRNVFNPLRVKLLLNQCHFWKLHVMTPSYNFRILTLIYVKRFPVSTTLCIFRFDGISIR